MSGRSFDPTGLSYDDLVRVVRTAEEIIVSMRADVSIDGAVTRYLTVGGSWGLDRDLAMLRDSPGLVKLKSSWCWQGPGREPVSAPFHDRPL